MAKHGNPQQEVFQTRWDLYFLLFSESQYSSFECLVLIILLSYHLDQPDVTSFAPASEVQWNKEEPVKFLVLSAWNGQALLNICYLLLQKHLNVTLILHTSPKNQNVCIFKTDILETQIIPGYKHFLETKHENLHQHERKLDFLF